jgi:transposase
MSQERLPMVKIREVLRLQAEGHKQRKIAASLICSRSTVQECLQRARSAGVSWPLPEDLDELALQAKLYPSKAKAVLMPEPDFDRVLRELARPHVTRRQLWREYRAQHPNGLKYTAFCVHFRRWRKSLGAEATLTLEHVPGDKLLVDYSGDPAHFVDRDTGEVIAAQLFVAVWAFSSKMYAEATMSMNSKDWLEAHVNALEAFGCAPAAVVPDNTKTAVIKACRYDPLKNREYCDFAERYSLAILPARAKKPRDKAGVEGGVLIAQRRILGALRDQVFFSLADLNVAIKSIVADINAEAFQKREGSRNSLFEQYERPAAQALPKRRYQYAEWHDGVRVYPDYHVQVLKGYYSVPYTLIGQKNGCAGGAADGGNLPARQTDRCAYPSGAAVAAAHDRRAPAARASGVLGTWDRQTDGASGANRPEHGGGADQADALKAPSGRDDPRIARHPAPRSGLQLRSPRGRLWRCDAAGSL